MLESKIPSYFKERRKRLSASDKSAVFLLPCNREFPRNNDVYYPFRQDSNFYYLSGFTEADSFIAVTADKSVLFCQERNPLKELWEGELYGTDRAKSLFGFEETHPISKLTEVLPTLLGSVERVYYKVGVSEGMDRKIFAALHEARRRAGRTGKPLLPIYDIDSKLSEMRLIKGKEEIENMRRATSVTALTHKKIMEEVKPGMTESQVEARLSFLFAEGGCRRLGYGSIVAGGSNATCLHYTKNNEKLKDGDLLLIDAGGEYEYYSADITRTFPVGKKFSESQAKIYDLVLRAQKEVISLVKPGLLYTELHKKACEVLVDGLMDLGLLKGSREECLKSGDFRKFYPHSTGHWLGMDVHDAGFYQLDGKARPLIEGMIFTVEPGLYFNPTDESIPKEYRGIGIRIEDNILVTSQGCEVLTSEAPKERKKIESLKA